MTRKTIAVIGGGASGALVCAQLQRQLGNLEIETDLEIEWIGNETSFGLGVAYGTRDRAHLLNVSARGMSAFPDQPEHFVEWIAKRRGLEPNGVDAKAIRDLFIPRMEYGEYISSLVDPSRVRKRVDKAIRIEAPQEPGGEHYRISLASGEELIADEVVLALGALSSIPGKGAYGALKPSEIGQIPEGARVLLIGTGLTMIDTILSLSARSKAFSILAISPRGLLPKPHALHGARPQSAQSPEFRELMAGSNLRLSRALRVFRREVQAAENSGSDWRTIFDEIRPHTEELWKTLTPRQKRQFYRHLRPYWDTHRHRVAPSIHELIESLQRRQLFRIEAARIVSVRRAADFEVVLKPKYSAQTRLEHFDALIDCTGFATQVRSVESPLLRSLIDQQWVNVDDPPIGVSARTELHPRIQIIGPLLRGSLWESVAIPELRMQAAQIAKNIAGRL